MEVVVVQKEEARGVNVIALVTLVVIDRVPKVAVGHDFVEI